MDKFAQDLRFAFRVFSKSPAFTAVAVLSVALGIGANTVIFSVFNAVLLKVLPYPDPGRLVLLWGDGREGSEHRHQVSFTDTDDWRRQNHVFENLAAYKSWRPALWLAIR